MNLSKFEKIKGYESRATYTEWYKRLEDNGLDPEALEVKKGPHKNGNYIIINGESIGEYIYTNGKLNLADPDLVYDVFAEELLLKGQNSRPCNRPTIERTPMGLVTFLKGHIGLDF